MKNYSKLLMVALVAIALIGVASAVGNAQFVNLVQKNPADWTTIDNGVNGKMMYKDAPKPMFVFNADGLVPGEEYALISYKEPWNGVGSGVLGTGIADVEGAVHIKGGADWRDNLVYNTYAADAEGDYQDITGAKIWLVPSNGFNNGFSNWEPEKYLFEESLILPLES